VGHTEIAKQLGKCLDNGYIYRIAIKKKMNLRKTSGTIGYLDLDGLKSILRGFGYESYAPEYTCT
jgi:hypothetical protein